MKLRSIIAYGAGLAAITGLPFIAQQASAAPTPMLGQVSIQFGGGHPQPEAMNWNDDQRRELRHIYWQLEHADRDYDGHRGRALEQIRHAAEDMGIDLHGEGYAQNFGNEPEHQGWSDHVLRRDRDRLAELADNADGHAQEHLREAIHQLDRALETQ